jgi:hypothetical protein
MAHYLEKNSNLNYLLNKLRSQRKWETDEESRSEEEPPLDIPKKSESFEEESPEEELSEEEL